MTSSRNSSSESAQVGDDRLVEAGEELGVLGDLGALVDPQPLEEELAELGAGAEVGGHAAGLLGDLLAAGQPAGGGGSHSGRSGIESHSPNESRDATSKASGAPVPSSR